MYKKNVKIHEYIALAMYYDIFTWKKSDIHQQKVSAYKKGGMKVSEEIDER